MISHAEESLLIEGAIDRFDDETFSCQRTSVFITRQRWKACLVASECMQPDMHVIWYEKDHDVWLVINMVFGMADVWTIAEQPVFDKTSRLALNELLSGAPLPKGIATRELRLGQQLRLIPVYYGECNPPSNSKFAVN